MSKPTIAQKSPIPVSVEAGKSYWWCSCGLSSKQPFCDGSHKGSDFSPMEYAATENRELYFCACKHTRTQPFCDGGHKTLD